MRIRLMTSTVALLLALPLHGALGQEVRDHRDKPQATQEMAPQTRDHRTAPQVRDHRTPRAAEPILDSSEAAGFGRQIEMLERRAASVSSMSDDDRRVLENSASSLLASMRRQISSGFQSAFGGTLGAVDGGTGTVSCLDACETEYSKCKLTSSEFLCDLQGAKCLLGCAVD